MPVVLTADICAHGVVAAARFLQVDPVKALTASRGRSRAAVSAAALAVHHLTGRNLTVAARIFGLNPGALSAAKHSAEGGAARALAHARQAMVAAGLDLSGMNLQAVEAPETGTVVAPLPVGPGTPAAPARVDHTDAIREALRRRKGVRMEVVGVEADKALIPEAEPHACRWPLGDLMLGTHRACGAEVVAGRMYCAAHCKAAGLKPTPKAIEVMGRVAAPYRDPRADNASGRKAAS